jgi:hypothetical protein
MHRIEEETELENNFWADVYCDMQKHKCSKEEAIKRIKPLYIEKDGDK